MAMVKICEHTTIQTYNYLAIKSLEMEKMLAQSIQSLL